MVEQTCKEIYIKEVILSRIAGYKYPDDDTENKAIQYYFSTPQNISERNIICISTIGIEKGYDTVNRNDLNKSLFFYHINSAILLENSSNQALNTSITVKDITRIVLQGRKNCRLPNLINLKNNYINYILMKNNQKNDAIIVDKSKIDIEMPNFSTSSKLSDNLYKALYPIINLVYSKSNDGEEYSAYNNADPKSHNYYSNDSNRNINYSTNNTNNTKRRNINNNFSNTYGYTISDTTLYNLIESPLLMECSSGEYGTFLPYMCYYV